MWLHSRGAPLFDRCTLRLWQNAAAVYNMLEQIIVIFDSQNQTFDTNWKKK